VYLYDRLSEFETQQSGAFGELNWRARRNAPSPSRLRFMTLDQFELNRARLTPRHKQLAAQLASVIRRSWQTMRPVGYIRLIGHTDSSGPDNFNLDLGNWRSEEVKKELETLLTPDILARKVRIAIIVEKSPGKASPIADNRTAQGMAMNRRVDVYFEPPTPPPDPPPPPPCLDPRKCVSPPPPGPPRPPGPPVLGRSLRQWLCEKVGCRLADLIIKGGCRGLEEIFTREGGTLSEEQKEELRQQCSGAANSPVR
jgi:outer membrane protein OmpA-like peptidoglycan-associated protein